MKEQVEEKNREKPEQWVKRNLVFELPKKVENYLEDLAKLCGTTVEEILYDELHSVLKSFHTGGFLDHWIKEGLINRDLEEELGCA